MPDKHRFEQPGNLDFTKDDMSSEFERFLMCVTGLNDELERQLISELNSSALRCLRMLSSRLAHFVDRHGEVAFSEIYIFAPIRPNETMQGLENIGALCRRLTINVSIPKTVFSESTNSSAKDSSKKIKRRSNALRRINIVKKLWDTSLDIILATGIVEQREPSSQLMPRHPDALEMDFRVWEHIFAQFTQMESLTLRVDGDPAWPGHQEVEETLLLLRICLERNRPRHLRSFTLSPIHAMGIVHLRWSSFGAFTEVPSRANARLWQNLTALHLRIQNPLGKIDDRKASLFLGILYDYLKSFSPSLTCLEFVWLGAKPGPSPLALEDEPGIMDRRMLPWPRLESFWFGNITFPNKTTSVLPECAPRCREVKALRSTHRFSRIDDEHASPWYDVPMDRVFARRDVNSLAASSIYSEQERDDAVGDDLQSQVVPVMLDVRSLGETLMSRLHRH